MKRVYKANERYQSGGGNMMKVLPEWDCLLYRQDWNGAEYYYFNENELDKIAQKIANGDIIVHPNYSVLIVKTQAMLNRVNASTLPVYVFLHDMLKGEKEM